MDELIVIMSYSSSMFRYKINDPNRVATLILPAESRICKINIIFRKINKLTN